jgi:hypothetical protein
VKWPPAWNLVEALTYLQERSVGRESTLKEDVNVEAQESLLLEAVTRKRRVTD